MLEGRVSALQRREVLKVSRNGVVEEVKSGRSKNGYQNKLEIELTQEEQESIEIRNKHNTKAHAFSLIGMKYSPLGKAENKVKRAQINLTPHYDRSNFLKEKGFQSRKNPEITLNGSPTRFKPLIHIQPKSEDLSGFSKEERADDSDHAKDESVEISVEGGKDLPEPPDQGELDIQSHKSNTVVNMSMQSDKFKQIAYLPKLMGKLNQREIKSETQSLEREGGERNFLRHTLASRHLTSQIYNSLVSPVLRKSSKALIYSSRDIKTRNFVARRQEDVITVVGGKHKPKIAKIGDNGSENLQNGECEAEEGKIEELRAIEPDDLKKSGNRKLNQYQSEFDKISSLPSSSRSHENLRTFGRLPKALKNECKCKSQYQRQLTAGDDVSSICVLSESTEQRALAASARRVTASPIIIPEACSQFCKNTAPKRQRELIEDLLHYQNSSKAKRISVKNKRFLISAAWWRRWKDYVDFDAYQQSGTPNKRENQYAIHTVQQYLQYDYPGIISNREILKPGTQQELRRPLLEHYDFEALSPSIWRYLKAWYGCDIAITRLLIRDKSDPEKFILNLYPD